MDAAYMRFEDNCFDKVLLSLVLHEMEEGIAANIMNEAIRVLKPDGTLLYAGNGKETTEFEINLSETGAYTVSVEARHAKGKISIRLKEVTQ